VPTTPRYAGAPTRSATTSTDSRRTASPAPGAGAGPLGRFAEAGSTRCYLQVMDLTDLDHLELIAAEVMPHL
jgi:hypothetical protein